MIGCPGCGSSLRFDIASQKLKCDYCGGSYDIKEAEELKSADSIKNELEVYEFECPQCGGTIYGDRQDMTGFCSYCGTPVELAGRLTHIERPKSVIPFQKTKEDCKKIFTRMVRKAPFLPKGYKDEAHIDSFRGIYMPYFLYRVNYDGPFKGKADGKSRQKGDYLYTDTYNIKGTIQGSYEGMEHDSSSTFDDGISEAIGPFRNEERMEFANGYLSGFYADASDELETAYQKDARNTADAAVENKIADLTKKQNRAVREITKNGIGNESVEISCEKAMYPVWFMSYRNGDRVAYAAVNGQTGKITADLPIDFKKFVLFSLLTAIPLFLLLNLGVLLKPWLMVGFYSLCSAGVSWKMYRQSLHIQEHEGIDEKNVKQKKKKKKKSSSSTVWTMLFIIFAMIFAVSEAIFGILFVAVPIVLPLVTLFFAYKMNKIHRMLKMENVLLKGVPAVFVSAVAILVGMGIVYLNPVADWWYYLGCLLLLACILYQLLMIVQNHNYLATRKPVQFNKEGGDDRA